MPKTLTTNELTVLGRVDILCDALEKDYENDNIRLHESSLRDEMHYSPYHEEALAAIAVSYTHLTLPTMMSV